MKNKALGAFLVVVVMLTNFSNVFGSSRSLVVDNNGNELNAPQIVIDKTVYVSAKPALEYLGWFVEFNSTDQSLVCSKGNSKLILKAGSTEVRMDGRVIILEKPVVIVDGVVYVPSKFIAREFGIQIRWVDKENLIIFSKYDNRNVYVEGEGNVIISGTGIVVNIFEPFTKDTVYDMLGYADRLLKRNQVEEAIENYNEILENISADDNPELYAHVLTNVGNAFCILAETKDVRKNINFAINQYEKVIELYKTLNYQMDPSVLNNLGNAYRVLFEVTGDRKDLDKSLDLINEVIKNDAGKDFALDDALVKYNIALTYYELGMKDEALISLNEAVDLYREALKQYTIDHDSDFYAMIQFNIGNIFKIMFEADSSEMNLQESINAYKEVLRVWSLESYPVNYAKIHRCIGEVYRSKYQVEGNAEYLELAIKEYWESLRIFSLKKYPVDYAKTYKDLGDAYLELSYCEADGNFLLEAVKAYNRALLVFKPDEYALNFQYIGVKLSQAYWNMLLKIMP